MLMGSLVTAAIQQDRSSERYALLERLSEIAAEIFPKINLEIQEPSVSFHAQAYVLNGRRIVTLLGGLAFHTCLQTDGLLFTILHEIGHHVAPGPRITQNDVLCCDCAADHWAVTDGQRLFSSRGMCLDIQSAPNEIESAFSDLMPASGLNSDRWCFNWLRRKKVLTSALAPPLVECEFRKTCWREQWEH
jgi:hypothetical protein